MTIDLKRLAEPFPKGRVSWRAQTLNKDGTKALALAYVDARDVQDRLDEVCGPENWQNRYTHATDKTVCEIGICVNGEWIWKADGAGDSDIEAEKGALSAAFKRAAVKWGVARYLYDLDTPWVPCESYKRNDGKLAFSKFTDDPWKYVRNAPSPSGIAVAHASMKRHAANQKLKDDYNRIWAAIEAATADKLVDDILRVNASDLEAIGKARKDRADELLAFAAQKKTQLANKAA